MPLPSARGQNNCKPEFIRDAHARGLGVMAWTVNSAEEMEIVMSTGVDAIVTDHPERIATVSAKVRPRATPPTITWYFL